MVLTLFERYFLTYSYLYLSAFAVYVFISYVAHHCILCLLLSFVGCVLLRSLFLSSCVLLFVYVFRSFVRSFCLSFSLLLSFWLNLFTCHCRSLSPSFVLSSFLPFPLVSLLLSFFRSCAPPSPTPLSKQVSAT